MICDNCEVAYDEIRHRWLCPTCGWKANCCEGEPLPAPPGVLVNATFRFGLRFASCSVCDEVIVRFDDGAWTHFDCRDNADHEAELDPEMLSEREAEEQLEHGRVDMPRYMPVDLVTIETGAYL